MPPASAGPTSELPGLQKGSCPILDPLTPERQATWLTAAGPVTVVVAWLIGRFQYAPVAFVENSSSVVPLSCFARLSAPTMS